MSYLGEKLRSEAVRFYLTLDASPTGTPTVAVEKQGASILAATTMTQGASTLEWYYDYTTGGAALVGAYQVKYTAVIDGVTRFGYDQYDQTIADFDSLAADIDTVDTVVDAILVDTTAIETNTVNIETKVDTTIVDIAAVPTVEEVDTELTSTHGAGSWQSSAVGSGAKAITINIKDGDTNNVEGVNVCVHNAANDENPTYASGRTDTNGNTPEFNLDGNPTTYSVRLTKGGAIVGETKEMIITTDATINFTVEATTASNPSDPDVCRLRIYPITLGNEDIVDLADEIIISSQGSLTKINDQYIKNTEASFTYDSGTDPDSYYFDAVRGSTVHVTCAALGLDHDIIVPDEATKNISDLQS